MVIYLEPGADLHIAQLMPLPLTVSCVSEILIGFTFLVQAHLDSHGQRAIKHIMYACCSIVDQFEILLVTDFQENSCVPVTEKNSISHSVHCYTAL